MSDYFSERLKLLRGTRNKAEFARQIGISPQVYQRYESGRVPQANILAEIAGRCGVSVEWLLLQEPAKFPSLGTTGTKDFPALETTAQILRETPGHYGAEHRGKLLATIAALEAQLALFKKLLEEKP